MRRIIVIAGAGIAGLTSALTLVKAGYRVQIIEKAARIDSAGVGIQLSPNATHILADLGLARKIAYAGFAPEYVIVKSGLTGQVLSRFPLGIAMLNRHDFPYLVLHRADLASILLSACNEHPDIEIAFNTSFEDCAMHINGVTVMALQNGRMIDYPGCALIGADGVGSTVRSRIVGSPKAVLAKDIAWRALVPVERLPAKTDLTSTHLWIAAKGHVVAYPVRNSRLLNIVAITPRELASDLTRRNINISPEELRSFFQPWTTEVRQLLASAENWSGWPLREINPKGKWYKNSTVLIGDAAHAMLPYVAQGGAAAIEDAAILAQCLAETKNGIPQGIIKYAGARRSRTSNVWAAARSHRQFYHMGGVAALARDVGMRIANSSPLHNFTTNRLQRRMDWIYGWKA